MKNQLRSIPLEKLRRDENQPRKSFSEAVIAGLASSMKSIGQQVPLLAVAGKDGSDDFEILDGESRWRAARIAGITALDCLVLAARPSDADRLHIQANIDLHRKNLSPMERSNLLSRMLAECKCSVSEVSEKLGISQAVASKLLAYQKLAPVIQQQLDAGEFDGDKAYQISQEPDHAKQLELLKLAATLSRDQFRQRAKTAGKSEIKTAVARFPLSAGVTVIVQGREVTLGGVIEALTEAAKELRKAQAQSLDVITAQRVMKDKAKAARQRGEL